MRSIIILPLLFVAVMAQGQVTKLTQTPNNFPFMFRADTIYVLDNSNIVTRRLAPPEWRWVQINYNPQSNSGYEVIASEPLSVQDLKAMRDQYREGIRRRAERDSVYLKGLETFDPNGNE